MKNTLIILAALLLVSCGGNKVKESTNKDVVVSAMPTKCGKSTFIVGEVKSYGNKGVIWGYYLQRTPNERVYLHNPKSKLEVGKKIVASGIYQPKNIGGLSGGSYLESNLMEVRIHQVLNKGEAIKIEAVKKECELLKNK